MTAPSTPQPDDTREALAAYSHDSAWAGWVRYMFSKGTFNADGTWTMPGWAVERISGKWILPMPS